MEIGPSRSGSGTSPAAKDYLASSASSCAAEQNFSLAADVFSSGCGSLNPRTIERCVSSHMWLKHIIVLYTGYSMAICTNCLPFWGGVKW
ncbi:hypothetical protein VP01_4152g1 [Puccinia sorghi]|uniref:HAT C-terminal dimerisation domain-containing protein n=1 Tax=Puccinia sorghi TaxID=27349 RepID=A0A0L6UR04_9BASI|nr:hypothetical protein VP01_4152g1 [Puccinia sorghi]